MKSRQRLVALLVALLVMVATGLGGAVAEPVHDRLALLAPPPDLPVVVLEVDTDDSSAAAAATAAGARSVHVVRPPGQPRIEGVTENGSTLVVGADGRVRATDAGRLRLPEAIDGLRRFAEAQVVDLDGGTPLRGLDAVLVHRDWRGGVPALVPGRVQPVDAGLALAVAVGTERAEAWLYVLPLWMATLVCGALGGLGVLLSRRLTTRFAWLLSLAVPPAIVLVGCLARMMAIDLPVGGLTLAVLMLGPTRSLLGSIETLEVLDGLSLRIGGLYRWSESARGPLEGIPALLAMHHEGLHVTAWRGEADGPGRMVAEAGPSSGGAPLARLPREASGSEQEHLEPVYEKARLVGAFLLRHPVRVPEQAVAVASIAARRMAWDYSLADAEGDPLRTRLNILRRGVLHTVQTANTWQGLFSGGELPIGIFNLSGDLVVGNRALRRTIGVGPQSPLVAALETLLADSETVASSLRTLLTSGVPLALRVGDDQTVLLSPLAREGDHAGLMLQVLAGRRGG